jgi:hypothetical protein
MATVYQVLRNLAHLKSTCQERGLGHFQATFERFFSSQVRNDENSRPRMANLARNEAPGQARISPGRLISLFVTPFINPLILDFIFIGCTIKR